VERAEAKALAAAPRFARNRVAAGRLAAALSFEAGRLDVLGRAAAADQRVAYAAARLAVLRAGAGLVAALSAVAGEGFAVPGLSPLRLPGLPQPAPARSLGLPAPVSPAPTPVAPPPPPPAYRTPVRPVAPSHQSSGPTFGQTKTVQTF
jgi:hypothetical protein